MKSFEAKYIKIDIGWLVTDDRHNDYTCKVFDDDIKKVEKLIIHESWLEVFKVGGERVLIPISKVKYIILNDSGKDSFDAMREKCNF